jgi:hypothetical protein
MASMPLAVPRNDPTSRDALARLDARDTLHGQAPIAQHLIAKWETRVPRDRWEIGLLLAARRVVG